jgi:hypothetical protein
MAHTHLSPVRFVDPQGTDPENPDGSDNIVTRCHVVTHNDRAENLKGAALIGGIAAAVVAPSAARPLVEFAARNPKATLAAAAAARGLAGEQSPSMPGTLLPQLGSKLEYFFGRATGTAHNVERSTQMLSQLESIGLPDTPAARQYITEQLTRVLNDPSSIVRVQDNGRIVRDSILMGSQGGVKFETIWEGTKLITGNIFGGLR